MKIPFAIFPRIAYRNSQFQIVSHFDNLKIEIYKNDKLIKTVEADSAHPTIITQLKEIGKITAKCSINNKTFEQEFEIKDAYRLGSSEFKRAFLFDESPYCFFLMKDRLLLYNCEKKILITENHYSPTEIQNIDNRNFLFVTRIGDSSSRGIVNLGIYNTDSLNVVGQLLNSFRVLKIVASENMAWVHNIFTNTISCYKLVQSPNTFFVEIEKFDKFNSFIVEDRSHSIIIDYPDKIVISSIYRNRPASIIYKAVNNAVDRLGNVVSLVDDDTVSIVSILGHKVQTPAPVEFKLSSDNQIYVGKLLEQKLFFSNFNLPHDVSGRIIGEIPEGLTNYRCTLKGTDVLSESIITHRFFQTTDGSFVIRKCRFREVRSWTFKKLGDNWNASPDVTEGTEYALMHLSKVGVMNLIEKSEFISILDYNYPTLLVASDGRQHIFRGSEREVFDKTTEIALLAVGGHQYLLKTIEDNCSVYGLASLSEPILENVKLLNRPEVEEHKIIWYSEVLSGETQLKAFDLNSSTKLDVTEISHEWFRSINDVKFYKYYALFPNQIVFNPKNLQIKDAFVGNLISHSSNLNKLVSHRANSFYLFTYDLSSGKYLTEQVDLSNDKYIESYLSPNGRYLVLKMNDRYEFYDIEKNEITNFISGIFLGFRNDGSLIVEQNSTRKVKIIDPVTFSDITPPNYHHYRFLSPDGKLYAQISSSFRYYNRITNAQISVEEVTKYRRDLDDPIFIAQGDELIRAKQLVNANRRELFTSFEQEFIKHGLSDFTDINSSSIVKNEKYTEIGIVGTEVKVEIKFPEDLSYYNYAAFSYDNRHFGYVGKPVQRGLIHLFRIDFDESNLTLKIVDSYLSRYPSRASWVCGFSKTGYFATYDSIPNTFIIFLDSVLFEKKPSEVELGRSVSKSQNNIYYSFENWNEIKGKNFLCFSPTGNFVALSEQGYEPLTLGGYGHQESNVVHIAATESGKIIDSFTGHGGSIMESMSKKVTFVAFSEDEKKLMTLSSDGVVYIRSINLTVPFEEHQTPEVLTYKG
ncbi:hypothetical protein [Flavihumibacter petaseus]|nr:hypothetical protein [Flavihumibacter petaseus]